MRLLEAWPIVRNGGVHTIELLQGNLAQLPPEQAVDFLVVSSFANEYLPTPNSLIGALDREGISVAKLAKRKAADMRADFSCWISEPLGASHPFGRILCVESGWHGSPPELADDLFRALAPASIEYPRRTVAMPVIGTGAQGWPADQMLESIVRAAVAWFRRGMSVETIRIVIHSPDLADTLAKRFRELRLADGSDAIQDGSISSKPNFVRSEADTNSANTYDLFISYSRKDSEHAHRFVEAATALRPGIRIFFDQKVLEPGMSWLMNIAESLDGARKVVALYTPDYWSSRPCKDEFSAAFTRQIDTGKSILFPILLRTTQMPYLFRSVQYMDCRECDAAKLSAAGTELCQLLSKGQRGAANV